MRKLYEVMASDVKVRIGKNATDGIFSFSATGRRIKAINYSFVTSLHYGIQLSHILFPSPISTLFTSSFLFLRPSNEKNKNLHHFRNLLLKSFNNLLLKPRNIRLRNPKHISDFLLSLFLSTL